MSQVTNKKEGSESATGALRLVGKFLALTCVFHCFFWMILGFLAGLGDANEDLASLIGDIVLFVPALIHYFFRDYFEWTGACLNSMVAAQSMWFAVGALIVKYHVKNRFQEKQSADDALLRQ